MWQQINVYAIQNLQNNFTQIFELLTTLLSKLPLRVPAVEKQMILAQVQNLSTEFKECVERANHNTFLLFQDFEMQQQMFRNGFEYKSAVMKIFDGIDWKAHFLEIYEKPEKV